jgi:hypothetical protein
MMEEPARISVPTPPQIVSQLMQTVDPSWQGKANSLYFHFLFLPVYRYAF